MLDRMTHILYRVSDVLQIILVQGLKQKKKTKLLVANKAQGVAKLSADRQNRENSGK